MSRQVSMQFGKPSAGVQQTGPSGLQLIVENFAKENLSLAANTSSVQTFDIAKEGYTAIGVVGFYTNNASTGGAGINYIVVRTCHLNTDTTVQMSIRNINSSEAKIRIGVKVLYSANL